MSTRIPANEEWYCKVFGTEFGPLPVEMVRHMVETEQLTADDLVRSGSSGPWRVVREATDLLMLLKGGGAPPMSKAASNLSESDQSLDEWYYQLEGRTHGPLTLAALVELIGASGDTAQQVVVRQGAEGSWLSAESLPGISRPHTSIVHREETHSAPAITRPAVAVARVPARTVPQFVRDNRDVAAILALWLLINGAVLVAWSQSYSTERKYFATLRSFEAKAKALQAEDASGEDWATFRARVKQTLAPMVSDLKKRANATEPIRQHLLWAARDQFPKCIGPRNGERSEAERLFQSHMQVVEEELAKQ